MDTWLETICQYAPHAHWIIFSLLLLAGLNIPISEDILMITAGAIASTCFQEGTIHLYLWVFAGSWFSAWEPYWIGRLLGPKLYEIKWFSRILTKKRIERLHYYYEKFGVFTFIVGRFCPGGVRNALFLTSGLGRMPFWIFIARDGVGALISTITLFSIGYKFGQHYREVIHIFKEYTWIVIGILLLTLAIFLVIKWRRKSSST